MTKIKRALDIICSLLALIAFTPLLIALYVIVYIDSDGHPIYAQKRITKSHKRFYVYKFTTMKIEAPRLVSVRDRLCFKDANDKRVTKVGRLLRKTSLDELPQLFNILMGDMSVVGPRPCMTNEERMFSESHFKHTAGLTGPTQIMRNHNLTLDDIHRLDDSYSIKNDIRIFFKTFYVIFKGK